MELFNLPPLPEPRKPWRRPDGSVPIVTPAETRSYDLSRPLPDDTPYHPPMRRTLATPQGMSERQAIAFLSEYSRRLNESLRLFEPLPDQQAFFDSPCHTRILLGGNRCLGGETEIYDPVAGVSRPIAEIDGPFHVLSRAADGSVVVAEASAPFVKAVDRLYRFTLSNGESFVATMRHRVLAADGRWVPMQEATEGVPLKALPCDAPGRHGEPLSRDASATSRRSLGRPHTSLQSRRKSLSRRETRSSLCLALRPSLAFSAGGCRTSPSGHIEMSRRTQEMRQSPLLRRQTPSPTVLRFLATENSPAHGESRSRDALATSGPWFCTPRRPCQSPRSCGTAHRERRASLCRAFWLSHWQCVVGSEQPVWRRPPEFSAAQLRRATLAYGQRCFQIIQGCLGGCSGCSRLGGERPRPEVGACRSSAPSRSGVRGYNPFSSKSGGLASRAKRTRSWTQCVRDALGSGERDQPRLSRPGTVRHLVVETCEFLRTGVVYDITVPVYQNYIHAGVASHNSGKTCAGAVACASITTNQAGPRYPKTGTLVMVAKDRDTLANTIRKKLFEPDAFRTIRDPVTRLMRAYRPHDPWDVAHRDESKPAEPLIPTRFYNPDKDIAWQDRRKGIPHSVKLNTGWEILFYSGESDPKPGFIADVGWIDEELRNVRWGIELAMRLIDRRGCLYWTATPENSSELLLDLHARFEAGDPNVGEWSLSSLDNPHLDSEARSQAIAFLTDENLRDTKVLGHFSLGQARVFPEWTGKSVENGGHIVGVFQIPDHWTRYIAIDPGVMPMAAIFVAVPPPSDPEHGKFVYAYDELVEQNATADSFAAAMAKKTNGTRIERFLIDHQRARVREMQGITIEDQLKAAFRKHGLESERQGSAFTAGTNDPRVRREALRAWLRGDPPRLRVLEGRCPRLDDELRRHVRKRDPKTGIITDQVIKKNDHLIDGLGYCAEFDPKWVAPPAGYGGEETLAERLARKARWQGKGRPSGISFGPGGAIPK